MAMLGMQEVLEKFKETDFGYEDRSKADSSRERGNQPRQEHKWWLPTPNIPHGGLSKNTRKFLLNQRYSLRKTLKETMSINAQVLLEVEISYFYLVSLLKVVICLLKFFLQ